MAFKVEPALSDATRQTEWGVIGGSTGRNTVSSKSAESRRHGLISAWFCLAQVGAVLTGRALTLHLGQGGSMYCLQGLGLSGPKSANWSESHRRRNLAFVSRLLSPRMPSVAGF